MKKSVVDRARALVGVRFRPQGRRPDQGLDCVGLVAAAAQLPPELVPCDYAMRDAAPDGLSEQYAGHARSIAPGDAAAGDILLVSTGPGQHHFVVLVDGGFVHADIRMRRVVERPGAVPWPVLAAWRVRRKIWPLSS
ncbi:peptidoglycan endopeptidase [Sphingosinicella sp. LY1275]|uniref:peptidoglycan endopeptidase n=1 Tax=Sphingosinicella sp. LY1275 TaxID=3095379 RepID=UPI002ADEDF2C|nr:peptidoglycan endopeptidase [Sphingosinicella sp. LY1275]MEA1014808.1 peptidoglycan endopeptidase [Sphingosinicella sp. LY1275]